MFGPPGGLVVDVILVKLCVPALGAAFLYPFLLCACPCGVPGSRDWLVICNFVMISKFCIFGCYVSLPHIRSVRYFPDRIPQFPWVMFLRLLPQRQVRRWVFCLKIMAPNLLFRVSVYVASAAVLTARIVNHPLVIQTTFCSQNWQLAVGRSPLVVALASMQPLGRSFRFSGSPPGLTLPS